MEHSRHKDSTANKGLHEADLASRTDELQSRIVAVESATAVAAEVMRTCMDANRENTEDISNLKSSIATFEAAQTDTSQRKGLEELQNAIMLLSDTVHAKADVSQVVRLEDKLGDPQVADSEHTLSTEAGQAVSEKLEQLACELSQIDLKAEDAAAAVVSLSSEVRDVTQQAVCIQVRQLPARMDSILVARFLESAGMRLSPKIC